MKLALTVYSSR